MFFLRPVVKILSSYLLLKLKLRVHFGQFLIANYLFLCMYSHENNKTGIWIHFSGADRAKGGWYKEDVKVWEAIVCEGLITQEANFPTHFARSLMSQGPRNCSHTLRFQSWPYWCLSYVFTLSRHSTLLKTRPSKYIQTHL